MTQGAIDLAQAELSTPAESALLLLQHEPYLGPRLLDAQPVSTKNPMLQAIAKYTWWDSKASVHICIPIGADISAEKLIPGQVQCSIQQQQLHCTITASTGHRVIQHKLSIPHLHAAIQPGLSTCLLDGQPVLLDQNTTPPVPSCSQTHHPALQYAEDTNRGALLKQCKPMPPSSPQAHNSPSAAYQQSPPSCRTSSMASHLQPLALSAATAAACASQVLITLTKADPSQVWEKLTRPLPVCQPCKLKPPSEQSMAALRRSLIHQRQQTQAQQGKPIACTAAALGLPAANSTQAAVGPDEHALQPSRLTAALDSRSHHLPAALAAAGASPGCNSATQETLAESVQVRLTPLLFALC